jgi:hypothetical protein
LSSGGFSSVGRSDDGRHLRFDSADPPRPQRSGTAPTIPRGAPPQPLARRRRPHARPRAAAPRSGSRGAQAGGGRVHAGLRLPDPRAPRPARRA